MYLYYISANLTVYQMAEFLVSLFSPDCDILKLSENNVYANEMHMSIFIQLNNYTNVYHENFFYDM